MCRNTDTRIHYHNIELLQLRDVGSAYHHLDLHRTVFSELNRIRNQVMQYLRYPPLVQHQVPNRLGRFQGEIDTLGLGTEPVERNRLSRQRGRIYSLQFQEHLLGVEP